jgi:hypothetical protein
VSLPKDFIKNADKELKLDGELVSYGNERQFMELERIERLDDSQVRPFFSAQAKLKNWDTYYGTATSGVRYTVLVEYRD